MVRFNSPAKKAAKATGKPSWSSWIPSLVPIITKRTIEFMHNVEKAIFVGSDEDSDSELKSLKSQVHFLQAQVRNIHATSGGGNNASIGSGSGLGEPFQSPGINASSRVQPTTAAEPTIGSATATSAHIVKRGLQLLELCETMEREGALAAQPQLPRVHPSNPFAPMTAFSKPPHSFNEAKPYSTAQNFYRATSTPYDPANPPMPPPPNIAVDMKYDWRRSASANGSAISNDTSSRSNDSTRNESIHPTTVHPSKMLANLNNLSNSSSSSTSSSSSVNTNSNASYHREVLRNGIQPSNVPNHYPTGGSSRYATYSRQQTQTANRCCESAISNAKSATRKIHQQTLPRNTRRESLTPEADITAELQHNGTLPAPSKTSDEAPIVGNINAQNENSMKQPLPISRLLFSATDLTQVKLKATFANQDPPSNNKMSFKRERQILRDVSNIIQINNAQGGYSKSHIQQQPAPSNHGTCIRSPSMVPTEPSTAFHPKKLFSSVDIRSVKLKAKTSQNATNRPAVSAINANSKWNAAVGHQHRPPISIQSALREAMKLRFAKMHATPESYKSSVNNSPSWD